MFHQGDLQSGISLAIQQAKLVVCFVRDASDESTIWEHEWLSDDQLATPLAEKSVALRLEADSQEAGFLSAFCPIPKTPALVVIHNGQLKLFLASGISRENFMGRLLDVLDPDAAAAARGEEEQQQPGAAEPSTADISAPELIAEPQVSIPADTAFEPVVDQTPAVPPSAPENAPTTSTPSPPPAATPSSESTQPEQPTTSSPDLTSLFPDRAARLETEKRAAEEAEAAARAAKAAGKRKAVDSEIASAPSSNSSSSKLSFAAQEKLRKQAQQQELNRILERVEADKRERKERERLRKLQREAELAGGEEGFSFPPPPAVAEGPASSLRRGSRGPASKSGDVCLRIRLLDGSQIREYFRPNATLERDVRPRVDDALVGAQEEGASSSGVGSVVRRRRVPAYSFKHILAPLPNRNLEPADERKELSDLPDVFPSATLVLMPARSAIEAYTGGGGGYIGTVYVAMLQIYNLFASFLATFFSPFGGRAGGGGSGGGAGPGGEGQQGQQGGASSAAAGAGSGPSSSSASGPNADGSTTGKTTGSSSGAAGAGASGIRIRTLRDQGDRGNEYYNGNSLDFEPKNEDEDGGGGGDK